MRSILPALAVAVAVTLEIVVPGRPVYHYGWYNVALLALCVVAVMGAATLLRRSGGTLPRVAVATLVFGTALCALAGVASGLFGPDDRTVIGAPGQRVRVDELDGTLQFPLVASDGSSIGDLLLARDGRAPLPVGAARRDVGNFIVRAVSRDVVYVQARDARGGSLTVTQPTGSAFLSPVLMMQQHQSIDGLDVPFDSFSVPAARRTVKIVLFTPQQAARMRGMAGAGIPAVLFAVDDANGRPLRNGIALAPDRTQIALGGLLLRPSVLAYPAIDIVAVPSLAAVVIGDLLILLGIAGTAESWRPRAERAAVS